MEPLDDSKGMVPTRILLSRTRAAYVGPGLGLEPHRVATATIAIALEAPFVLTMLEPHRPHSTTQTVQHIALIPPGQTHHLKAQGPMVFIYLDALSDDHARFQALNLTAARRRLLGSSHDACVEGGADTLCEALGVPKRPLQGDTPVIQAIRLIDRRPQDFARVKDIAKVAGLSASRFQVLVREATGMAFRRYRLWRRMSIVMHHVARGETLTTTAYAAGFASSAHLSTTFKAMFGISPSRVLAMRPEFDLEPL